MGEDIAYGYLVNKKYKIIERNHRKKWGELDIIARAPDKTLVFIEVKTLRPGPGQTLQPEDNLTGAKLEKLKRTASLYAGRNQNLVDDEKGWRLDLIAIALKPNCEVKHYENL